MIKTTPHITLSEEQDKRETIQCIFWPSVVVFGMIILLIYGMAFLSWTEPTMEDLYARKSLENRITTLENHTHIFGIKNHRHQFWTGKIKKEVIK